MTYGFLRGSVRNYASNQLLAFWDRPDMVPDIVLISASDEFRVNGNKLGGIGACEGRNDRLLMGRHAPS